MRGQRIDFLLDQKLLKLEALNSDIKQHNLVWYFVINIFFLIKTHRSRHNKWNSNLSNFRTKFKSTCSWQFLKIMRKSKKNSLISYFFASPINCVRLISSNLEAIFWWPQAWKRSKWTLPGEFIELFSTISAEMYGERFKYPIKAENILAESFLDKLLLLYCFLQGVPRNTTVCE